ERSTPSSIGVGPTPTGGSSTPCGRSSDLDGPRPRPPPRPRPHPCPSPATCAIYQGSMPMEIRVHTSIRSIPEPTWGAPDGGAHAPFLSWAWLAALEQTGCVGEEAGWPPPHLTFWEDDRLVGAAPTYLKDNSDGEFVFDHGWAAAAARAGIAYYP